MEKFVGDAVLAVFGVRRRTRTTPSVPAGPRLAALRWAHEVHRDAVAGEVAFTLRSDDVYAELVERAARKRSVLASAPTSRAPEIDDRALVSWYFGEQLGPPVPVALDAWASANGWRRVVDFVPRDSSRVAIPAGDRSVERQLTSSMIRTSSSSR